MENWEEKFKELSETWVDFAFDGEDEYNTQGFEYDEAVDFIKKLLQQTRLDTLRQVLPEKLDVRGDDTKNPISIARESGNYGRNECIEEIEQKAKEIWGFDIEK